ncbi:sarcolemmal membrane-associated protein [Capsicum chacoense]
MAGLLAWAADVVGGGKSNEEDDNPNSIPLIFTPQQQSYLIDLDRKATSLTRTIQDLRLRLPPPDISERLPHLHAHSLASNNALALQLNAHSATKEQAQLREITLQEENAEYDKAISDYENKIQVKSQEADLLRSKLQEMALVEENLRSELERAQAAAASESVQSNDYLIKNDSEPQEEESANSALLRKLEEKKKELTFMEEAVHDLEKKWTQVQDYALKQPLPAQREKILDKQLHSLIEQLASKQAQAEGLANEVHLKEMELERLNGLWRKLEADADTNATRNRGRQNPGRREKLHKLMLLRSAFVVYILALHILVFIKISF